jgi:hypothetical protein
MYALTVIAYVLESEIETFLQKPSNAHAPHGAKAGICGTIFCRTRTTRFALLFMKFIARRRIFYFIVKRNIP